MASELHDTEHVLIYERDEYKAEFSKGTQNAIVEDTDAGVFIIIPVEYFLEIAEKLRDKVPHAE